MLNKILTNIAVLTRAKLLTLWFERVFQVSAIRKIPRRQAALSRAVAFSLQPFVQCVNFFLHCKYLFKKKKEKQQSH